MKENVENDVRTEENSIRNVSKNCENASLENIMRNKEMNFQCNFEVDFKFSRKIKYKKKNFMRSKYVADFTGILDVLLIRLIDY